MQADCGQTIHFEHESHQSFNAVLENSFLVLPDAKTVVGRSVSDLKQVVLEDIATHQVVHLGKHSKLIRTFLYHHPTRSLLVGDNGGRIVHYQKVKKSGSFTRVKDYGDVEIGPVFSSAVAGDFGVFGGCNTSCLKVVDVLNQKLVEGKMRTAFKHVDSLQVCEVSDSKVVLSVGGRGPSYSGKVTDIFEVVVQKKSKEMGSESEEESKQEVQSDSEKEIQSVSESESESEPEIESKKESDLESQSDQGSEIQRENKSKYNKIHRKLYEYETELDSDSEPESKSKPRKQIKSPQPQKTKKSTHSDTPRIEPASRLSPLSPRFQHHHQSMSQDIIQTLISNIKDYIDNILENFAKAVATQIHAQKSKFKYPNPN